MSTVSFIRSFVIPERAAMLPVRDMVLFPHMVLPLSVGRAKSMKALEHAMSLREPIVLVAQRKVQTEDPGPLDLHDVGTAAEILQLIKMPDNTLKILVKGLSRVGIKNFVFLEERGYVELAIQEVLEDETLTVEIEALTRRVKSLFEQYVKLNRRVPYDVVAPIAAMEEPASLADTVAAHLFLKMADKQEILETFDTRKRLERLCDRITSEIEILGLEHKIQDRVRAQIDKSQKEYYLNEQMKAIQKELKQKDDNAKELEELNRQIKAAKMTPEAQEAAQKEVSRLEKMTPYSPEATVIRAYLDWLVNMPWAVKTRDRLELKKAEQVLNHDHFGLEKPKERILEYLAVCKLAKKLKGPILCFVGPPGVGKTSLARSIAKALGRKFSRISLGGVRDEAEIRGHRRTYIGSLPGRLVQALRKAKSKNPVILLDEIDKMASDWRGDPAAALLEALDPEQNQAFTDHYLDVGFDLSQVLFITTANTLYSIPHSLQDRLEIIRFSGYTLEEKLAIAQNHLMPKQTKEHGLDPGDLSTDGVTLARLIRDYTHEAGVRNLEREIARLARKAAREVVGGAARPVTIDLDNLEKYLGVPHYHRESIAQNGVGVSTGLAWTEVGGELLSIEVSMMPGRGKLTLTGKLGNVMQESAQAALTYVRTVAESFGIKNGFFKEKDFHLHVPEGAVPKDGPSAGVAIAMALASAVSGRAVKKGIAMTGEITLRGQVLPIGGLKEKVLAAVREDVSQVLYPEGNKKDLAEIPQGMQDKIKLIPVKNLTEAFEYALQEKTAIRTQGETVP